jgi:hypothetical protein
MISLKGYLFIFIKNSHYYIPPPGGMVTIKVLPHFGIITYFPKKSLRKYFTNIFHAFFIFRVNLISPRSQNIEIGRIHLIVELICYFSHLEMDVFQNTDNVS